MILGVLVYSRFVGVGGLVPGATPSVEIKGAPGGGPSPHPIALRDVQALVMWVLSPAGNLVESPRWAFVKNKPLVQGVVLVLASGLSSAMMKEKQLLLLLFMLVLMHLLPFLSNLGRPAVVHTSPQAKPAHNTTELLKTKLSQRNAKRKRSASSPAGAGAATGAVEGTEDGEGEEDKEEATAGGSAAATAAAVASLAPPKGAPAERREKGGRAPPPPPPPSSDLHPGMNRGVAVLCRPLVFVSPPLNASGTLYLICVDTDSNCFVLALTHIHHDAFHMSQLLTITHPDLKHVDTAWPPPAQPPLYRPQQKAPSPPPPPPPPAATAAAAPCPEMKTLESEPSVGCDPGCISAVLVDGVPVHRAPQTPLLRGVMRAVCYRGHRGKVPWTVLGATAD
ncbi:hypothetical protein VOLCADRAFT_97422 [Volvox carteri f. nagariensis]|uniref:Uncharacterized protein n=1 Tax=Volvox carteri f. nagariensis TaxID=3068 RepID=D8UCQ4_VOLCA|nr:uncharacterized protein VOLCADRAFT_97422 [Volvox carteri f. nagariensis]EFJ42533.1 hypothetical protein VOLCADRAFT_97422 [Volvox carteri f. nagariensis]|eukprot:XP_002956389.1 hypothetical protein VOLCADRAFT_97422 [Volvox carteri f. nagariensis]